MLTRIAIKGRTHIKKDRKRKIVPISPSKVDGVLVFLFWIGVTVQYNVTCQNWSCTVCTASYETLHKLLHDLRWRRSDVWFIEVHFLLSGGFEHRFRMQSSSMSTLVLATSSFSPRTTTTKPLLAISMGNKKPQKRCRGRLDREVELRLSADYWSEQCFCVSTFDQIASALRETKDMDSFEITGL